MATCAKATLTLPVIPTDTTKDIDFPTVGTVTKEVVSGSGVFDIYMRAGMNQLNVQWDKGRIKGSDYAQAYVAMMQLMMTEANKFVLGVLQAEVMAKKAEYEIFALKYSVITAQETANKTKNEAKLICTQEDELVKNGVSKRKLEDAQEAVAREQINLYKAQAKGYSDKNRNDTLKSLLNSWAVQSTEVSPDLTTNNLDAVTGHMLNSSVNNAKMQAGI